MNTLCRPLWTGANLIIRLTDLNEDWKWRGAVVGLAVGPVVAVIGALIHW